MSQKISDLIHEIGAIIDHDFDGLQSWQSLADWPLYESRNLNGTLSTKVIHTRTHIRFVAYLPPGADFDKHYHDCMEVCTITSGALADRLSEKIAHQDETVSFMPGILHQPYNPNPNCPTWVRVDFYR